ncbi:MAG: response regulator [Caldimicrobium sp.]|jgi:DNA-binding response OmpR family regulator
MILVALSEGIFEKIKPFLEKFKVKYEKIETGEELLEKAKKSKPELVILEKDLPLFDGFAVTLLLKSNPKTKEIPILAVCKCDYQEEEIKARDSGADGIIHCPIKEEEVVRYLERYLKK